MKQDVFLLNEARKRQRYYDGNTLRTWKTFTSNLERFQSDIDMELTSSNLDEYVIKSYFSWMRKKGNQSSTIKSNFEKMKTILNHSSRQGYLVNPDYRYTKLKSISSSSVYLDMSELFSIYDYNDNLTRTQILAKDLFLISSLTALRFSDVIRIKPFNLVSGNIDMIVQKTSSRVVVPVHPLVSEIFKKYSNDIPSSPCLYYVIKTVRNICYNLKINNDVLVHKDDETKLIPKYKLIGTHTARRSACTNMYLEGISPARIMKITGHKSETNFFRYIRVDKEENADFLRNTQFFNYGKENK